MGNCNISSSIDGNFRVPQPQDETIIQTELTEIAKDQMKTFQIPFDTYVLIEYANMAPIFINSTIVYKKQKYDQISKAIKKVKGLVYQDECFNVNNSINSVISYIDENMQEMKMINKYELSALNNFKISQISKVYINNNGSRQNESDIIKLLPKIIKEKENFVINKNNNNLKINTFGNPNLVNIIIFLLEKDNLWIKNLLYKFDYETKIFIIKLYIQGVPRHILLDESIPINDRGEPAFINPPLEQFWILLVEKAIAKVNRSYGNSLRCFASELLPLLSNIPLIQYNHEDYSEKELWKKIKEGIEHKYIIFGENKNKDEKDQRETTYPSLKFISFFISNVFKINNNKYLELTIPMIEDNKIIQNMKKDMLANRKEDIKNDKLFTKEKLENNKIIFMPYDYYYTFFKNTFIYKHEEQYIYSTKKLELNSNQFTMLKIKPLQKTHSIITVHLKDSRYSSQDIPFTLNQVFLVRLKVDETIIKKSNIIPQPKNDNSVISDSKGSFYEEENEYLFEYINSSFSSDSKSSIEANLDPNETYYIMIKLISNVNMTTNCVVSLYSSTFIELVDTFNPEDDNMIEYKFFQPQNLTTLTTSLKYLFISHLNNRSFYDENIIEDEVKFSKSINDLNFGFKIVKIENFSEKRSVTMTLEYNSIEMNLITLKLSGKANESQKEKNDSVNEFKVVLAPGSSELLIFQCLCRKPNCNFSPQFIIDRKQQFRVSDFQTQKKTKINPDIYYQEIPYGKGVFIILINSSDNEYVVRSIFDVIDNLEVDTESEENEVEMILKPFSKNFINLKMIDTLSKIAYQITFLAKINQPDSRSNNNH